MDEMDNNLALSAVELVLRSELNCNAPMESDSFFWFGLLSFSELIDEVSQFATQLLYREMTLSKCGVACTLPGVLYRLLKSDQLVNRAPILLFATSF